MASKKKSQPSLLLYANPETDPDLFYFGKFAAPDPFLAFRVKGRSIAVVSPLEYGRALKESAFDEIWNIEDMSALARQRLPKGTRVSQADIVATAARQLGETSFTVSSDFPLGLADSLRRRRFRLEVQAGSLFPERELKTDAEAEAIREGNRLSVVGFKVVEKILKAAVIKGKRLLYQGKPLTSEWIQTEINLAIIAAGGAGSDPIVAGGDQACDPHERGHGLLRPHELIIVDIFPQHRKTRYYGDMTRTYLKGTANEAQKALVAAVAEAQRAALAMIKQGVDGGKVHAQVQKVFADRGYETGKNEAGYFGFFHGTGHGLGLAVHEAPRVSLVAQKLKVGHVVTVEPGLYYPGLGGCRIEDVVRVEKDGYTLLSHHPYRWQFK